MDKELTGDALAQALKKINPSGTYAGQQDILKNPIDLAQMGTAVPTLPTNDTNPYSGIMEYAKTATSQEMPKVNDTDNQFMEALKTVGEPIDTGAIRSQLENQAQLQEKQQKVSGLKAQIEANNAQAQAGIQQLESQAGGRDVTSSFLGRQQQEIQRQVAIRNLPLTAQYQAELGNLQAAQESIDKLFTATVEDRKAQQEYKLGLINTAYQIASNKEKKLLDAKAEEIRQQERNEDRLDDIRKQYSTLATQVGDFGLAGKILTAKDENEVSRLVSTISTPSMGGGMEAPTVKSINGRDMQWNAQAGKWEDISTPTDGTSLMTAMAKGNIDDITSITQDPAIRSAVGPTGIARFVGRGLDVATGARQNFIASVEQLRSQLNLDTLVNAKARGATFGALSDNELQVLANAATKLGSWAIKDKSGTVTGYRANEKDFKAELDKINNYARLDYILKGGTPEDAGAQVMTDGSIVVKNSDGSFTKLR